MVDGVGVVADELLDLRVALRISRRLGLHATVARERGLLQQLAHALEAPHQARGVVLILQKGRVDQRRHLWVGAGQAQRAAAPGAQQADVAGIPMAQHRLAAMVHQLAHHEVQLQVGDGLLGAALDETAGFGEVGGERATALAPPFEEAFDHVHHAGPGQTEQVGELGRVDHHHHVGVVVQVGAHTGQVVHHADAVFAQVRRRADAREHEQLR